MEVHRYLRLQVFTVSPTDDLPYTCFETGTGPMQMCTAVISTSPQNSASVQLFMGGEAPADAPCIECPKDSRAEGSLTVAVYQSDARIAHAIIPLSEVWEVCHPSIKSLVCCLGSCVHVSCIVPLSGAPLCMRVAPMRAARGSNNR